MFPPRLISLAVTQSLQSGKELLKCPPPPGHSATNAAREERLPFDSVVFLVWSGIFMICCCCCCNGHVGVLAAAATHILTWQEKMMVRACSLLLLLCCYIYPANELLALTVALIQHFGLPVHLIFGGVDFFCCYFCRRERHFLSLDIDLSAVRLCTSSWSLTDDEVSAARLRYDKISI